MTDVTPAVAETSAIETPATADDLRPAEGAALCGLEGCENPLPAPALDEQGRRKGGRPSRYCSKAHADAASRARRARDTTAVSDPLSEVRSIGVALLPGIGELLVSLTALQQRFADAEQQAFAQVTHAETEAGQAREDAAHATARADQAERQRREALAQARDHQRERDQAVQSADRIRQEADEIRSQAWETVATHERARGQAEAACTAAGAERDRLATELQVTLAQLEHIRVEHMQLADALAAAQAELAEAHQELARLRDESAQADQQLSMMRDQLRTEREQRDRSQVRTRELEIELRATRDRLTEANSRVDALIATRVIHRPEPPPDASASRHLIWLGRPVRRPASGQSEA